MRGLLLFLSVVVVVLAQDKPTPDAMVANIKAQPFKAAVIGMAARLDSQEVWLNQLDAKVQKLSDRVTNGETSRATASGQLTALNGKLDVSYGNGCDKGMISCGGSSAQCVSTSVMCDGKNDCTNGGDEQSCDNPMISGSSWVGQRVFDTCTSRKPQTMRLDVADYTGKVASVSLAINSENSRQSQSSLLFSKAYYNAARQSFVMTPPESDGLGIICNFVLGRSDRCVGYVVRVASGERCALFVFDRQ